MNHNKRKGDEEFEPRKKKHGLSETVASHYNNRGNQGLKEREQSKIFYMRNYNNWIKSMLINDALKRIRADMPRHQKISVLDLCSGKGGDLLKWKVAGIDNLTCVDIAETSVEHSRSRYDDMVRKFARDPRSLFSAQFLAADCSKTRIKPLLNRQNSQFDITSCQFALHYSFESLQQAQMMMKNACESLRPGGLFIGTIPNANVLMKRLREAEGMSYGNAVYRVEFDLEDKMDIPLFGAKYHFFLEDVVNCPEFLVYIPLLKKLAEQEDMELIHYFTFKEFHDMSIETQEGQNLLKKMMSLKRYPPQTGGLSGKPEDYQYARSFLEKKQGPQVATLSKPEWEATNLYLVFMFQKVQGKPVSTKWVLYHLVLWQLQTILLLDPML